VAGAVPGLDVDAGARVDRHHRSSRVWGLITPWRAGRSPPRPPSRLVKETTMPKRRRLRPVPTTHKPPPTLPRRPLADFSVAEREQLLEKLRGYQAAQAEEDVAFRRRYVDKNWDGTTLDDEDALLIASMPGAALRAATRVQQQFLSALATWLPIKPPSTTKVRAALEREVAIRARWMLDEFLPVVE